jgi:hypothetical protein
MVRDGGISAAMAAAARGGGSGRAAARRHRLRPGTRTGGGLAARIRQSGGRYPGPFGIKLFRTSAGLGRPYGCLRYGVLASRPLGGGIWTGVVNGAVTGLIDPDDLIATQAGIAAALVSDAVIVIRPGQPGRTVNPVPCPSPAQPLSVAVISATRLAILCTGEGYTGHTIKQLYVSGDGGAHWTPAGRPSPDGDGGTLAATSDGWLAIATESAASWLFYSPNAGASWQIVNQQDDGGQGWADLGFTTATDGVVVRGPADSDGNSSQRPGQLLLTDNAGASWYQVSF